MNKVNDVPILCAGCCTLQWRVCVQWHIVQGAPCSSRIDLLGEEMPWLTKTATEPGPKCNPLSVPFQRWNRVRSCIKPGKAMVGKRQPAAAVTRLLLPYRPFSLHPTTEFGLNNYKTSSNKNKILQNSLHCCKITKESSLWFKRSCDWCGDRFQAPWKPLPVHVSEGARKMQKFREDPGDQIGLQHPRARNRLGSWAPAAVALNSDLCIILVRMLAGKTGACALL